MAESISSKEKKDSWTIPWLILVPLIFTAPFLLWLVNPYFGYLSGALILLFVYTYLGKKISKKISEKVISESEGPTTLPASEGSQEGAIVPFLMRKYMAADLPVVPGETAWRYEAPMHRGPAMNKVYKTGIGALAVVTVLTLWTFYFFFAGKEPSGDKDTLFFFSLFLTVLTLFLFFYFASKYSSKSILFSLGFIIRAANEIETEEEEIKDQPIDISEASSIRCRRLFLLGIAYTIVALTELWYFHRKASLYGPGWGIVLTGVPLLAIFGYLFWLYRQKRYMEARYPFHPPYRLLALWVSGSPHLEDFLQLLEKWKYYGIQFRLDGPDTVRHMLRDLVNYFRGHVEDSIVKNEAELDKALASFHDEANPSLQYATHSIQCTDTVWTKALRAFLEKTDVVMMDLASLSGEHMGIVYGLGKIVDEIPSERLILLIDDTTDEETLQALLSKICREVDVESPNYPKATIVFNLLHTGGLSERQLISHILTVAHPRQNPEKGVASPISRVRWADPFPSQYPTLWSAVSLTVLVSVIIWILAG